VIDMTELGAESIKTHQLHSKYLSFLIDAQNQYREAKSKYNIIKKLKTDLLLGRLDRQTMKSYGWEPSPVRIVRTELDEHLEADTDVITAQQKMEQMQQTVKTLESIIQAINGRGYLIKNALDWLRFTNGQ
jgi:hypothetical protein